MMEVGIIGASPCGALIAITFSSYGNSPPNATGDQAVMSMTEAKLVVA